MALFVSTSVHRIDKKGRVSVPAQFRAALEGESFRGVALTPPLADLPCIEGSGFSLIERITESIEEMNPLSEERDALALAILSATRQIGFDGEGRIVLPEDLIAQAELEGEALFAGLGSKFQIWNPKSFEEHRRRAVALARKSAGQLPWSGGKKAAPKTGGAGSAETGE